MSNKNLLDTKPTWCDNAIATDDGWTDPKSGELLVAIKQLKSRLGEFAPPVKRGRGRPRKHPK